MLKTKTSKKIANEDFDQQYTPELNEPDPEMDMQEFPSQDEEDLALDE